MSVTARFGWRGAADELSASLIQRWPGRFGGFAALPLPDVDGALAEPGCLPIPQQG
jgi:hypothetical protein